MVEVVKGSGKEREKNQIELSGKVRITIRDKTGKIREIDEFDNMITNAGRVYVAKKLYNDASSANAYNYIQIGTGTTSPTVSDTQLQTYYAEGVGTTAYEANYKMRISYLFSFTETVSITESGIFNDAQVSGPNMLARQTFAAKNMANGETLEVVWTVSVG